MEANIRNLLPAKFSGKGLFNVRYLTGTDEHGQKIEQKAQAKGQTPKETINQDFLKKINKVNQGFRQKYKSTNTDYTEGILNQCLLKWPRIKTYH